MDLAARANSDSLTHNACDLTIRFARGICTAPNAITTLFTEPPNAAIIAKANTSVGIAIKAKHPSINQTAASRETIEDKTINTLRFLSVDQVNRANSGHPGAPMGAAPIAYTLYKKIMKHNPGNPRFHNRDRFILSIGHASALLYSVLHLSGYDFSLEDLKNFRQFGSKTPGHPERDIDLGIEVTTGPLGQGFANGVGMAISEKWAINPSSIAKSNI